MAPRKSLTDAEKAKREEVKAGNFRRLFNARMEKMLKSIRAVEPLGNKSAYKYTPEQIQAAYNLVCKTVDAAFTSFSPSAEAATTSAGFDIDALVASQTKEVNEAVTE